jgi:hydrogenase nickel incorporation protein HypB
MFRKADMVLVTKIDLLPQLPHLNLQELETNIATVMQTPRLLQVSATTGAGIPEWIRWLRGIGQRRGAACATCAGAGQVV